MVRLYSVFAHADRLSMQPALVNLEPSVCHIALGVYAMLNLLVVCQH